jgi:hypothetical protein
MSVSTLAAADKTWTGSVSKDWMTAGNWQPPGVPASSDRVTITSGQVVVTAPVLLAGLSLLGGTLTASNAITVTRMVWTGGTHNGRGLTIIPGGGQLLLSGNGLRYLTTRTLYNLGTTVWTNDGGIGVGSGGSFDNGGFFEIHGDGNFYWTMTGASPIFKNRGTLVKYGGDRPTSFSGVTFTNEGLVEVRRGGLSFANYNQSVGHTRLTGGNLSASYNVNLTGGLISGSGVLAGNVVNDGATLAPGNSVGTLRVLGRLGQKGVVNCEIRGPAQDGQFDRIQITSGCQLGGELRVCVHGYRPSIGEAFEVVNFYSFAGAFQKITGLDLGGGLHLAPVYGPTNLTLVAVAGAGLANALQVSPCGRTHAHVRFVGSPYGRYVLQSSDDAFHWHDLLATNTPNGAVEFLDENFTRTGNRLFRVVRGQ